MTAEKVNAAVLLKGQLSEDGRGSIRTTCGQQLIVSNVTPLHLQYLRSQQNFNLGCVSVMWKVIISQKGQGGSLIVSKARALQLELSVLKSM